MSPLDSAWLKLKWAQRHLDTLYGNQRAFYGKEDKPREGQDGLTDTPQKGFKPPPVIPWTLIVGDAIYNMRCALDHLAYALAVQHLRNTKANRLPKRATAFPLFLTPDSTNFDKMMVDIEPAAQKKIDTLQPYDRRNCLWLLAEVANADKHHQLAVAPAVISWTGNLTAAGGETISINVADGSVVALDPATGKPLKQLQPAGGMSVGLRIRLPKTGGDFPDSQLQEIHDFISRDVLPVFTPFFT